MSSVIDLVKHYQNSIEKYGHDEQKLLKSIDKLHSLDVTVKHLQDTGVGRTVNALRKEPGALGQAARALVYKWKLMVAAEESDQEGDYSESIKHNDKEKGSGSCSSQNNSDKDRCKISQTSPDTPQLPYQNLNGEQNRSKRKQDTIEDEIKSKKSKKHENRRTEVKIKVEKSTSDNDHTGSDVSDEETDASMSSGDKTSNKIINVEDGYKDSVSKLKPHRSHNHKSKKKSSHHKSDSRDSESNHSLDFDEKNDFNNSSITLHSQNNFHKPLNQSGKEMNANTQHSHDSLEKDRPNKYKSIHTASKHSHSENKIDSKHQRTKYNETDKTDSLEKTSKDKYKSSREKSSSSSSKKHIIESDDFLKVKNSSKEETSRHSSSEKRHSSSSSKSKSSHSSKDKDKSDKHHKSSSSSSGKMVKPSSKESKDKSPKKSKVNNKDGEGEIDCESGASFAEALGMISPIKNKKKNQQQKESPKTEKELSKSAFINDFLSPSSLLSPNAKLAPLPAIEISSLPEISPNYRPRPPPKLLPHMPSEDAMQHVISSKTQRTKVYSGNKMFGHVPTLYELCVQILQEHIDSLEYTGGVPYDILKPVVDKATPHQLLMLEHYNPYLMEETDHLWHNFCQKHFRNKQRQEMETWRDMYMRCQEEQEHKLKSLTENIKIAQEAKKAPIKQTKMAYVDSVVKPPRNIARKQALHGTAHASSATPAARVPALAAVAPTAVRGPAQARLAFAPSSLKPKKAPLMQKALQFMRGGRKR